MAEINYKKPLKFIWDKANEEKNWIKHKVTSKECEEVFFDSHKQEYPDPKHSQKEIRKIVVGKTKNKRLLLIVYTLRKDNLRIISARNLNKRKEADLYEKAA